MELIGQRVLVHAGNRAKPLRAGLAVWASTVQQADWRSLSDVRRTYPSADGVRLGSGVVVTVFNIKGNEYRLLAWVDYDAAIVEVLDVLTHAEYSKDRWKSRY